MLTNSASLIGAFAAATILMTADVCAAASVDVASFGSGYSAADAPLGAASELRIDLRGQVAPRCELTATVGTLGGFDLNQAGEAHGDFAIDCNSPFRLRVRSERGGFATETRLDGIEPLAAYAMSVAVGTDAGRQELGWCAAGTLVANGPAGCAYGAASGGWSSGDATAIGQTGAVALRWEAPGQDQARFGAYQDVIIIEVEVRS